MTERRAEIRLRAVEPRDIEIFLGHHSDPAANRLAAFSPAEPPEPNAFAQRWAAMLTNPDACARTILAGEEVTGYVARFIQLGRPSVSYWIGREWWSRGVATSALGALLAELPERPLFARAAKDNVPSLRVLEKNGFRIRGEDRGFAPARGTEVEEWILSLE